MSLEKATVSSYSIPNSTNVPAFDVYSAALSIDPQNVTPTSRHCDNCFNDVTSEMKVFHCNHSVCQKCLEQLSSSGSNYYSPLFGNQACPICCSDAKPIVNSHQFLPNGNSLPPHNGGYIPMHYPPPPDHNKPLGMDPFSSLLYNPTMPPPPPPRPPMSHMNGGHFNPFQSYNGPHSNMKIHPNMGNVPPPHCSPNLPPTMSSVFTNPNHMPPPPDPTLEMVSSSNSPIPLPQAFNAKQMPMANTTPFFPPNMHLDPIQTLPTGLPQMDPIHNSLQPMPPHSLPPTDPIHSFAPNSITTDSIPTTLSPSLPSTDVIQNDLPTNSQPNSLPSTVSSTLPSILPSSSTSTSLTSSEASSGSSSISNSVIPENPVQCTFDEAITAIVQCIDCGDYLCETCVKAHRKVR